MQNFSRRTGAAAGLIALLTTLSSPCEVAAGPVGLSQPNSVTIERLTLDARARTAHRRGGVRQSGPGPAAVLGLFGAIVGGALANSNRYENYSYQSYGDANDYGYGRRYGGPQNYGRGYGVRRGIF